MRSKGGQKLKHCDQYYLNKKGLLTADLLNTRAWLDPIDSHQRR